MRSIGFSMSSAVLLSAVMPAAALPGDSATPDKSGYNLFHPTPAALLRNLEPDRPDKTESPYTLDAGHFQLEMDFANFTYDRTDSATTRAWNVAPFNIKAGLLNNVDLQFVFGDYLHVRTEDRLAGTTTTQSGIGDLTTRLKINLWGNDGGQTAFALLPFLTFPTGTDGLGSNGTEGGVIFPLAVKLPHEFDLGLETAVVFSHDDVGDGYHENFINSITVSHGLVGRLDGYLEFYSDINTGEHSCWVGTVDAGLGYSLTENVQLDCGCNFGVTAAADDYNPFAGLTWRF